jgi:hypothetical protein
VFKDGRVLRVGVIMNKYSLTIFCLAQWFITFVTSVLGVLEVEQFHTPVIARFCTPWLIWSDTYTCIYNTAGCPTPSISCKNPSQSVEHVESVNIIVTFMLILGAPYVSYIQLAGNWKACT